MEKVKIRLSIVPYAGITQIRCGRSLTLPLRLYTDSHILYGHMIAQNKKNVKETMEEAIQLSVPLIADENEGATWYEAK